MKQDKYSIATLGGGCFWCVEAVLQRLKGVYKVRSGYSGGNAPGVPTYREICSGKTGHAEVVAVTFNPTEISFETLLEVFLTTHDPTTLNRQGADVGTQYRSVIFYESEMQRKTAQKVLDKMATYFPAPIVTSLEPFKAFHIAETEHQDYYNNHTQQGYCQVVIEPKLRKLRALHATLIKH